LRLQPFEARAAFGGSARILARMTFHIVAIITIEAKLRTGDLGMDHEESLIEAAHRAERAARSAMRDYKERYVHDEDDITGFLVGALRTELTGTIGHLTWAATILRHRKGAAAEEKQWGADILIHVNLVTPTIRYAKGVLIQAKRLEFTTHLFARDYQTLISQCNKMLVRTPAAFVFAYARNGIRCRSASIIAGSTSRTPYDQCVWTSYRFFLELFRCPIGDPSITSARVEELPVPTVLQLQATEPRS
jgi:hypothetical protein